MPRELPLLDRGRITPELRAKSRVCTNGATAIGRSCAGRSEFAELDRTLKLEKVRWARPSSGFCWFDTRAPRPADIDDVRASWRWRDGVARDVTAMGCSSGPCDRRLIGTVTLVPSYVRRGGITLTVRNVTATATAREIDRRPGLRGPWSAPPGAPHRVHPRSRHARQVRLRAGASRREVLIELNGRFGRREHRGRLWNSAS